MYLIQFLGFCLVLILILALAWVWFWIWSSLGCCFGWHLYTYKGFPKCFLFWLPPPPLVSPQHSSLTFFRYMPLVTKMLKKLSLILSHATSDNIWRSNGKKLIFFSFRLAISSTLLPFVLGVLLVPSLIYFFPSSLALLFSDVT